MTAALVLVALLVLILLSVPIGAVLLLLALGLAFVLSPFPLSLALGEIAWSANTEFLLISVPIFILMGEVMLRSGLATEMFGVMAKILARLPGGLLHANIAASALFAATSGSSVATAATIGTVAIPAMERGGYNRSLFLGSIAGGGTLGILIPPSINMIVYGVLSDTSVRSLYIAALIPGVALAVVFSLVILVTCVLRPSMGGREEPAGAGEILRGLPHLLPPLFLFLIVVGSIYFGVATPSEAAALGLMATIGLAALRGRLNWRIIQQACENCMRVTAMVMLIVTAAFFLTFVLSSTGVTTTITDTMLALDLSPVGTMLLIVAIYLVLGCFMETLTLMVATTPIVVPVIMSVGYDPVWFGVVFMILIECALITPPIGMNLFVVQSIYPRARFVEIARGALPFLGGMLLMIFALIAWPDIALWAVRILG